jgi:FtsZ-interacting cell division protein ZipA
MWVIIVIAIIVVIVVVVNSNKKKKIKQEADNRRASSTIQDMPKPIREEKNEAVKNPYQEKVENINSLDLNKIGITGRMSDIEKKRVLSKAYFKYNDMLISEDKKIREEAQRMIDIIINERGKI